MDRRYLETLGLALLAARLRAMKLSLATTLRATLGASLGGTTYSKISQLLDCYRKDEKLAAGIIVSLFFLFSSST